MYKGGARSVFLWLVEMCRIKQTLINALQISVCETEDTAS